MVRKIDRTGEERLNNFGSKMTIKEYRNKRDIDVCFPEYNWVFKHATYQSFKKRNIRCLKMVKIQMNLTYGIIC